MSADQYANCTVSHKMHADRRFDLLAELAGWSRPEACWRIVELWARCTALATDQPGERELRIHLGPRAAEILVEALLAELLPDGAVRVRGLRIRPRSSESLIADPPRVVTYAIISPRGDVIKVGRTKHLDRRIVSLQTAHHEPLVLFGFVDGDREESLHAHLDALGKRIRGEWFRLDDETLELLAGHGITRSGT